MIETIYSNENGEGSQGKVQASFRMPKNVRQIGKSSTVKKIYIEDYVMTYVKQLAGGDFSRCRVAILLGQCIRLDNCRNIFISGAVEVTDIDPAEEIRFSNDTWTGIYDEIKKYFVETEIVGWFLGGPGFLFEDKDRIMKAHVNNFAGQDKTLLTYDNMEKEETFYSYENNRLTGIDGYYIYYEKNEEMQNYMVGHKELQPSSEANYDDKVSRDIRAVLQTKKTEAIEKTNMNRLIYAAGTLMAIVVLIVGAAVLNNYDQMRSMQDTLNYLSQNMEEVQSMFSDNKAGNTIDSKTAVVKGQASDVTEEQGSAEDAGNSEGQAEGEESLDVEVVPGEVEPASDNEAAEEATKDTEQADSEVTSEQKEVSKEKENDDNDQSKTEQVDQVKYYTVRTGDTLADISYALYHTYTKVNKIMELNGIEDQDLIYVGQKLIVP